MEENCNNINGIQEKRLEDDVHIITEKEASEDIDEEIHDLLRTVTNQRRKIPKLLTDILNEDINIELKNLENMEVDLEEDDKSLQNFLKLSDSILKQPTSELPIARYNEVKHVLVDKLQRMEHVKNYLVLKNDFVKSQE